MFLAWPPFSLTETGGGSPAIAVAARFDTKLCRFGADRRTRCVENAREPRRGFDSGPSSLSGEHVFGLSRGGRVMAARAAGGPCPVMERVEHIGALAARMALDIHSQATSGR